MTGTTFVLRGLWYFRNSYLGVMAGTALGVMVLLGALIAGDSVKATLRQAALARLGTIEAVLGGGDRFFRAALADDLAAAGLETAPVLVMNAVVSVPNSGRSLAAVQVVGVDRRFFQFGPEAGDRAAPSNREFYVNDFLARTLKLNPAEPLVLRFSKPTAMAGDVPLAGNAASLEVLRGEVAKICDDAHFGRFSLTTSQLPQATVFMPIERLQEAVGQSAKANLLLLRDPSGRNRDDLLATIQKCCKLEDYGLSVVDLPLAGAVEIRTSRVFFDPQMTEAVQRCFPAAQPVITYLVNTISAKGKATPYSMVTAVEPAAAPFLPGQANGAVLNAWQADDLGAEIGDEVKLDYYALDAGNRLVERSATFPVVGVVPLEGLAADRDWMPNFPGVADAENTTDWDPGVPLDMTRVREKDEAYWDEHRGTPKLFIPLAKGRELFGNRWGEFTALRVPKTVAWREVAEKDLLKAVTPATAGLVLREVRMDGLAAANSPVDFAGLLLGMSFFLMVAAVALAAMLFRFHIEQRNRESGLLTAVGIPASRLLRWRLGEGLGVVAIGSLIGVPLAVGYTGSLLGWLATIWSEAGEPSRMAIQVQPATILGGVVGFSGMMMLVIWLVTRKQASRQSSIRIAAGIEEIRHAPAKSRPWGAAAFGLAGLAAATSSALIGAQGAFFLAGFCFLAAGLAGYRWVMLRRVVAGSFTAERLVQLNCGRRSTRSLVVVGCLAAGVFLVISVAAFRKHGNADWQDRASGTGGFALWVELTNPLGRSTIDKPDDVLGLGDARKQFGELLPIRVGSGDAADCFNLNTVSRPRLLATDVAALARRGSFTIKKVLPGCTKDWETLRGGEVMRAFVDESTLLWVLKRKLGDRFLYQDEWGQAYPVEIAGTLADSVFQGSLVVDEARFLKHHPTASAARIFLLDRPSEVNAGTDLLQQALADRGVVVTPTAERLAAFHGVENTYISIFQVLGGLGVILGSAGLGLVTARNLAERRYEFAIFTTLGIPSGVTRRIVLGEVAQLTRWGLGIGLIAAFVAILPTFSKVESAGALGWLAALTLVSGLCAWGCAWLVCRRYLGSVLQTRQLFNEG